MKQMSTNTNRIMSLILVLACMLVSCTQEPLVIKDSDTFIVIKADADVVVDNSEMMLIEYMEKLKADSVLYFEIAAGMITSINGIENPADFSSCWMLYTSDAENANSAWGTVEYEGVEYASAIYGAEQLQIKPGCIYIWVFKSFEY